MISVGPYEVIDAVLEVAEQAAECSRTSLVKNEGELWFELVACVLGSRVPFEMAQAAAVHLKKKGILTLAMQGHYELLEHRISEELARPIYPPCKRGSGGRKYRFHDSKATQIRGSAEQIYGENCSIRSLIRESNDMRLVRKELVRRVPGVGSKQSSLFLRNVGCSSDLAVLDSHVLQYMNMVGLIRNAKVSLTQLSEYETIETILRYHATDLDTSLDYLDTAIWVVMRESNRINSTN